MSLEILLEEQKLVLALHWLMKKYFESNEQLEKFSSFDGLSHFCSALAARSPDWDIFNKWHYDQNLGALPRCTSNKNCVTKWNIFLLLDIWLSKGLLFGIHSRLRPKRLGEDKRSHSSYWLSASGSKILFLTCFLQKPTFSTFTVPKSH